GLAFSAVSAGGSVRQGSAKDSAVLSAGVSTASAAASTGSGDTLVSSCVRSSWLEGAGSATTGSKRNTGSSGSAAGSVTDVGLSSAAGGDASSSSPKSIARMAARESETAGCGCSHTLEYSAAGGAGAASSCGPPAV